MVHNKKKKILKKKQNPQGFFGIQSLLRRNSVLESRMVGRERQGNKSFQQNTSWYTSELLASEREVLTQRSQTEAWLVASEVWGRHQVTCRPAWPPAYRDPDRSTSREPGCSTGVHAPASGDEATGAVGPGEGWGSARRALALRLSLCKPRGATLRRQWHSQEHGHWMLVDIPDTSFMTGGKWENSRQTDFGSKGRKKEQIWVPSKVDF